MVLSHRFRRFLSETFALLAVAVGLTALACVGNRPALAQATGSAESIRVAVSYDEALRSAPVTGRLFLALSPDPEPVPRIAAYNSARRRVARVPFFAMDVEDWRPGEAVVLDARASGYPLHSLSDVEPGTYYVQAVLNVYTRFERADGHVIYAPMDQWEGQRWAFKPGNFVSTPTEVRVDPANPETIRLTLTETIPPVEVPEDTRYVKRFKIQSEMLTEFWGHPIYLGATVLLPEGYDEAPNRRFPAIYLQNHFSLDPAFGFTETPPDPPDPSANLKEYPRSNVETADPWQGGGKKESGYAFHKAWVSDTLSQMVAVTFQHPTPYYDDSYAVNSVNHGPYADALLEELIPAIEERFRLIREPYARILTGGSTGGWSSLALQIQHPTFFGGVWCFYPDPIDFRRFQLINIYEDENAFIVPDAAYGAPERMLQRSPEGQPLATVRQISQLEHAQGTRGRSAAQIDAWNAAFAPITEDGYPAELWDKLTGEIDRDVALYMRDNGYDLRYYLEQNWAEIGPDLVGKITIFNPEMDDFYLPLAVYLMEDFLESTTDPYYDGRIIHGRPMKAHGWSPMTNAALVEEMARHVADRAPQDADRSWLR
jgi:hypothetical protein